MSTHTPNLVGLGKGLEIRWLHYKLFDSNGKMPLKVVQRTGESWLGITDMFCSF